MVQAFDMAFDLADGKNNEKDLLSRDEEVQVSWKRARVIKFQPQMNALKQFYKENDGGDSKSLR